jgi:threonine dehydratase
LAGGRALWLKREDVHELGAFKWRGAEPAVQAFRAKGAKAVVTASTGNHGAATAWAAARCGLSAIVFAPQGVSRTKLALLEQHGADVRLMGRDMDDAKAEARRFAKDHAYPFFEDGAEPAQYRGYGAIGQEILDQLARPPAAVVVPIGNGALIGGIGQAIRRRSAHTAVVGVVAKEAPVMALSFEAGRVVACDRSSTCADGLAVRVAIPYAVEVLAKVVTRMVRVTEREIARAVAAYGSAGLRVEAAAAAALAALPQLGEVPGPVVLIVTGGNIDDGLYHRALTQPESFPE